MRYGVIAAVDEDWGIGKNGLIPWHYSEDFKFFKDKTQKATCFMGRKTYEEIAGMREGKDTLLPNRNSVVISQTEITDPRVRWCGDINEWNHHIRRDMSPNFFIGGRFIFEFGLQFADTVYITRIPGKHDCDVFFPKDALLENFTKARDFRISEDLVVEEYERKV